MWIGAKVFLALLMVALLGVGGAVASAAPTEAPAGHEIVVGVATKVSGNEITLRNPKGEVVVLVDKEAWIFVGGKEASLEAIKVGMRLTAAGERSADGKVVAKFVVAGPRLPPRRPMLAGRFAVAEVVNLSEDTLTVKTLRNVERQVTLTNQTIIEQLNGKDVPRSDLVPGTKVIIRGRRTTEGGAIEARRIIILPKDFKPGERFRKWLKPNGSEVAPKELPSRPGFRFGPGHPGGPGWHRFERPGA